MIDQLIKENIPYMPSRMDECVSILLGIEGITVAYAMGLLSKARTILSYTDNHYIVIGPEEENGILEIFKDEQGSFGIFYPWKEEQGDKLFHLLTETFVANKENDEILKNQTYLDGVTIQDMIFTQFLENFLKSQFVRPDNETLH